MLGVNTTGRAALDSFVKYTMRMLQQKWRNLRNAFFALIEAWRSETSFRVQVLFTIAIFVAAWYYRVTPSEWALLVLSLAGVLTVELLNTAIERTGDAFGRRDPDIGLIKDLGAAAAGTIGLAAVAVSTIVLIPHLLNP